MLVYNGMKGYDSMAKLIIERLAKERKISMAKLSRMADLSINTVQFLYHNPETDRVTLATLNKIANALGVEVQDLFEKET